MEISNLKLSIHQLEGISLNSWNISQQISRSLLLTISYLPSLILSECWHYRQCWASLYRGWELSRVTRVLHLQLFSWCGNIEITLHSLSLPRPAAAFVCCPQMQMVVWEWSIQKSILWLNLVSCAHDVCCVISGSWDEGVFALVTCSIWFLN